MKSGVGVNQSSCSALLYFNPLIFFTYGTLLTTHDNAFGVLDLRVGYKLDGSIVGMVV